MTKLDDVTALARRFRTIIIDRDPSEDKLGALCRAAMGSDPDVFYDAALLAMSRLKPEKKQPKLPPSSRHE